jgi:hypothetical protein
MCLALYSMRRQKVVLLVRSHHRALVTALCGLFAFAFHLDDAALVFYLALIRVGEFDGVSSS